MSSRAQWTAAVGNALLVAGLVGALLLASHGVTWALFMAGFYAHMLLGALNRSLAKPL